MNRVFSLPRLAVVARKFQIGNEADSESVHVAAGVIRSFSFQVNPARSEELSNKKFPRP
jgi:hypothetical protein